jgi:hypothetical protein
VAGRRSVHSVVQLHSGTSSIVPATSAKTILSQLLSLGNQRSENVSLKPSRVLFPYASMPSAKSTGLLRSYRFLTDIQTPSMNRSGSDR